MWSLASGSLPVTYLQGPPQKFLKLSSKVLRTGLLLFEFSCAAHWQGSAPVHHGSAFAESWL